MKGIFRNKSWLVWFALLFIVAVSSCKVGEPYQRQAQDMPLKYRNAVETDGSFADRPWWELFNDPVLVNLVDSALVNNKDLKMAVTRIREADALLGIARADLYPSVNYAAAGNGSYNTTENTVSGSVQPGINISYQVDLWGRIRKLSGAALQQYLATEEAYKALRIQIINSVAQAYITLRDLDNRLIIAEKTAKNFQENLDVMQAKFNAGLISEVDLTQAKIQVSEALTAIEVFTRNRNQVENAISILLGVPPMAIPRGLPLMEQIDIPEVPSGLPSELLSRRPDVQAAEYNLHAQTLKIGAAEALRYPSLTLSSNLAAELINPSLFFADLSAQLLGPIFNGKRIEKNIEAEKAKTEGLLYNYQNTFLTALKEVEDALIAVETYKKEFEYRRDQMEMAEKAANLSWVRYDGGMTSYLEVLTLQTAQFNAQLNASQALSNHFISIVSLYTALGGGWLPRDEISINNNR